MANLAIAGSHSTNGVAEITANCARRPQDRADVPERQQQDQWRTAALAAAIESAARGRYGAIGDGWITHLDALPASAACREKDFATLSSARRAAKWRFTEYSDGRPPDG
jgi:hypothetical protein